MKIVIHFTFLTEEGAPVVRLVGRTTVVDVKSDGCQAGMLPTYFFELIELASAARHQIRRLQISRLHYYAYVVRSTFSPHSKGRKNPTNNFDESPSELYQT